MKITGEMHFAKALAALEAAGVSRDALKPGELYSLAHAAARCANPFSEVNAELADRPIFVCLGVWLWPPTAGALIWLTEFAAKWWKGDSLRFHWAHVYALIHAREPEAFARLTDRWAAWRAVARCALRLAVHGRELAAAIRKAYGEEDDSLELGAKSLELKAQSSNTNAQCATDFARIVARLEVESGIPRITWLWGRSLLYVYTAYAEMRSFAAACAGKGGEGRMNDELDEALTNLAKVKAGIVRRVRSAAEKPRDDADHGDGGEGGGAIDKEVAPPPAGRGAVGEDHGAGHAGDETVVNSAVGIEHTARIIPQGGEGGNR